MAPQRLVALALAVALATACAGDGEPSGWTQAFHPSLRPAPDGLPEGVTPPGVAPIGQDVAGAEPAAAAPQCADPMGCYGEPDLVGIFDAKLIPEASGLAASRRNPGVLYLLDDQPGTTGVWAIRETGEIVASLPLQGLDATDTESLAVGPCDGGGATCLYVADTGDNVRDRPSITILRAHEPDLSAAPPGNALPAEAITLTYPDAPQDAEALLVDADGTPYLVTKGLHDRASGETAPARLYAAPGFTSGVLRDLGTVPLPLPERALASLFFGNVVTGGDALPGRVLLRTYDHVVEYVASGPEADLAGFPSWPSRAVPSSWQPQAEAVTYAADGCGYYSASEMSGDLWFTPCVP